MNTSYVTLTVQWYLDSGMWPSDSDPIAGDPTSRDPVAGDPAVRDPVTRASHRVEPDHCCPVPIRSGLSDTDSSLLYIHTMLL